MLIHVPKLGIFSHLQLIIIGNSIRNTLQNRPQSLKMYNVAGTTSFIKITIKILMIFFLLIFALQYITCILQGWWNYTFKEISLVF